MAKGISIAALILSIFFPFVGLILGIIALNQERKSGENGTMAIVAIALGALGTVLSFIVAIAGIATFGVFSPARYVQERCIGNFTKFECTSVAAVAASTADDTVSFELANYVGDEVLITSVSSQGDCGGVVSATIDGAALPVRLEPNEEAILSVTCEPDSVREEAVFQDEFTIGYEAGGLTGLRGSIEVVVET